MLECVPLLEICVVVAAASQGLTNQAIPTYTLATSNDIPLQSTFELNSVVIS
jgi:hypothetical protein